MPRPLAALRILYLLSACATSLAHVKSILKHSATPPESLTAKYYHAHAQDSYVTPSCAVGGRHGGVANGTAASFCLHDAEYPVAQIEHAIKYHYHAVASIYKVGTCSRGGAGERLNAVQIF